MSWFVIDAEHEVHVVPDGDDVGHDEHQECSCGPHVEWVNPDDGATYERPLVVHHSLDGREANEV